MSCSVINNYGLDDMKCGGSNDQEMYCIDTNSYGFVVMKVGVPTDQ